MNTKDYRKSVFKELKWKLPLIRKLRFYANTSLKVSKILWKSFQNEPFSARTSKTSLKHLWQMLCQSQKSHLNFRWGILFQVWNPAHTWVSSEWVKWNLLPSICIRQGHLSSLPATAHSLKFIKL